jgi:hypothetical protein
MQKSKFLFLFLICLLTTTKCTKECQLALADMTTNFVINSGIAVLANEPFIVENLVNNLVNTLEFCSSGNLKETMTAENSDTRLRIDFDLQNDSTFNKNLMDHPAGIKSIPPGDKMMIGRSTTFYEPGRYRLIHFADDTKKVNERNENNNSSNMYVKLSRSTTNQEIIINVLPNPNYKRPEGEPYVRILSTYSYLVK